ncbi:MAG: hemolysin family protein [Ignavibacteria bacterium]
MEIFIIILLAVLNGIFAMAEIALVSSRRIRLEEKAKKGSQGAKIALILLKKPEEFLSTVQFGITLTGIIAGAYGGVALAKDITPFFAQFDATKKYAVEISYVAVVGIITYLSIIIGELVPKTIAFNNPERIAITLSPIMRVLSILTNPVIRFLSFSTKIVVGIFHIKSNKDLPVTEEELKILIEQGGRFGTIEKKETEMIKSIFRFGDRNAYSIMTNRQDIIWLDINDASGELREIIYNNNFSKFPLCDGSIDQVIGIISIKDYLQQIETGKEKNLRAVATQPLYIPENLSAIKILERFRETKIHIAIVINEYGSTEGMITLHDLIENIFGELPEKHEIYEIPIFKRDDGSLLIDGAMRTDELRDTLSLQFEHPDEYTTLGGYVMFKLNKVPQVGDKFDSDNYKFEVVDMDGKRVDKVLVKKLSEKQEE